jgi:WhiB family transcriptional regulator, redox-sensing transcriptional regulator
MSYPIGEGLIGVQLEAPQPRSVIQQKVPLIGLAEPDVSETSPQYEYAPEDWQEKAACRGPQSKYFYPPEHKERKDERIRRQNLAKDICRMCEVRLECLEYAIATRDPNGIWGGYTEDERKRMLG